MLSARRSTKVLKAATGENCTITTKEMSRTAGVKKPHENPKSESPLENDGAARDG